MLYNIILNNYNIITTLIGKKNILVNMSLNEEVAKQSLEDIGVNLPGIIIESTYSVEDDGEGVMFNVFVYNVQPGIEIDYATGESWLSSEERPANNKSNSNKNYNKSNSNKVNNNQSSNNYSNSNNYSQNNKNNSNKNNNSNFNSNYKMAK